MGMGEEILSDMMAQEDARSYHFETLLDNKEWSTSDGKILDISEMDRSHIVNTINFIKRKPEFFFDYTDDLIHMFKEELKRRDNPKSLLKGIVTIELNGNKHKITVKELLKLNE